MKRTSGSGSPSPKDQSIFVVRIFRAVVLDLAVDMPANGLKAVTARGSKSRTAAFIIVKSVVMNKRFCD
jgi:hypothetical protein